MLEKIHIGKAARDIMGPDYEMTEEDLHDIDPLLWQDDETFYIEDELHEIIDEHIATSLGATLNLVYNYRTKRMESREDAIDFPIASSWVKHYAEQGLTRDYPPEFYQSSNVALEQRIASLEEEIQVIKGQPEFNLNCPESLGDRLERKLDEVEAKSKKKGVANAPRRSVTANI